MYDLILFDLDGTLVNTIYGLKNSVNTALKKYDMPQRTLDEVLSFVGNGIRKLIERSVSAGTTPERTEEVFKEFKSYYEEHCLENLEHYNGVEELVDYLYKKEIPMAVVTNKNHKAAEKIIKAFFGDKISVVVGAHENIPKKPDPAMVNMATDRLKEQGKSFLNPVFIGDSDVDIATGKNCCMDTISVSWGFRSKEFLLENGAEKIAENTEELKKYLGV